jgi:hypothetical protein
MTCSGRRADSACAFGQGEQNWYAHRASGGASFRVHGLGAVARPGAAYVRPARAVLWGDTRGERHRCAPCGALLSHHVPTVE